MERSDTHHGRGCGDGFRCALPILRSQNSGDTGPTFSGPRNTAPSTKRESDMAARALSFPEAFPGNEALDFALDQRGCT